MNFFKLYEGNIANSKINPEGIDIMLMVKAMKSISSDYPTVDDLNGLVLIFVHNALTVQEDTIVNKYKMDKNTTLYIAKVNEKLVVDFENESHVLYPKGHVIVSYKNEKEHNAVKESEKKLSEQELLALNWFQTGETGVSSKTMCLNIFPKVKKYLKKLGDLDDYNDNPYDNSDFKRCMKFVKQVNVTNEQLLVMKNVDKKWSNLVDNWQEITLLIESGEKENLNKAYNLIKNSINITVKNKIN